MDTGKLSSLSCVSLHQLLWPVLSTEDVFEYLSTSMCYDKQGNNEVLHMQTIYIGVPIKDETAELRSVLDCSAFIQPLIYFTRFTGI